MTGHRATRILWYAMTSAPIVATVTGAAAGLTDWNGSTSHRVAYGLGVCAGVFIGAAMPRRKPKP